MLSAAERRDVHVLVVVGLDEWNEIKFNTFGIMEGLFAQHNVRTCMHSYELAFIGIGLSTQSGFVLDNFAFRCGSVHDFRYGYCG